jgi:hypothetical protein
VAIGGFSCHFNFSLNIFINIEAEKSVSGSRKRAKAMTDGTFLDLCFHC